jgi:hypothetical protein
VKMAILLLMALKCTAVCSKIPTLFITKTHEICLNVLKIVCRKSFPI